MDSLAILLFSLSPFLGASRIPFVWQKVFYIFCFFSALSVAVRFCSLLLSW